MAIARALLTNPEIVLADEPTADLDEENTDVVFRFLKQTAAEGCTVMLVTHEASANTYADVLYTMQNGKLTGGSQK
jgi:putative ABC transport system ATP-binding protein